MMAKRKRSRKQSVSEDVLTGNTAWINGCVAPSDDVARGGDEGGIDDGLSSKILSKKEKEKLKKERERVPFRSQYIVASC